jgi:hypothetical protein
VGRGIFFGGGNEKWSELSEMAKNLIEKCESPPRP